MTGLAIREVDPADEDALRLFHDIYLACGRHDQQSFVASPYAELASVVRTPTEDFAYTAFLAFDGDVAVGQGWYAEFRRANRDKVVATPRVLPEHRRRGVGSALLARLEDQARSNGRTVVLASPRWAAEHGPEGVGAPSVEFARAHGYDLALVEAKRRLALPVDDALLERLAARTDTAYAVRAFAGPVPQEWVQGWAELEASLSTEAPTGDLDTEEFPASVAAIRDDERVLAESGRTKVGAIAFAPDGAAVGYSEITVDPTGAVPAMQEGTLVLRAHRGHGLGHGLKAALLRLLQAEHPGVSSTITCNALDNGAMVAVNDRLGYQMVDYLGDVQKRL